MTTSDIDADASDLERLRDLPIRSEEIGFAAEAMIACQNCGRANAPVRSDCIYCGVALEGSKAEPRRELRELESWENGFNIIVTGAGDGVDAVVANDIAALLSADSEMVLAILGSEVALPLKRVESEEVAVSLVERLATAGIEWRVVSDEMLFADRTPLRLRSVAFGESELTLDLFGKPETQRLQTDDLALIVSGWILHGRSESIEKRKRRTTETLSETQTSSDEPFIDIYSRYDPTGWRIPLSGFDFSCLGPDMSLYAVENMESIIAKLADNAPTAKVVGNYAAVRSLLEHTWPSESRKDSLGVRRSGIARKGTATVFSTNNQLQVTKFSRLQWHLL